MNYWRRPKWFKLKEPEYVDEVALTAAHPPITRDQHIAAKARLERDRHQFIDHPTFGRIMTGVVMFDDLCRAYGYSVTHAGYDRFGWKVGHLDSPCQSEDASGHDD